MRLLKSRLTKFSIAIMVLLLIGLISLKITFNDDIPQGTTGRAADELALRMLDALGHKKFLSSKELHWTFRNKNRYEWKLQQGLVDVYWDDYRVSYVTNSPRASFAWKDGHKLSGTAYDKALEYAQTNFNNDSFWVIGPHKLFDPGVERQAVTTANGNKSLLVTYTSGGTTPGDVYQWILNDDYLPVAMKMWVQIIPLDGITAQWQNWQLTEGGFPLPQSRSLYGIEIPVSEVKVIP